MLINIYPDNVGARCAIRQAQDRLLRSHGSDNRSSGHLTRIRIPALNADMPLSIAPPLDQFAFSPHRWKKT
jgi:hypothetical protein